MAALAAALLGGSLGIELARAAEDPAAEPTDNEAATSSSPRSFSVRGSSTRDQRERIRSYVRQRYQRSLQQAQSNRGPAANVKPQSPAVERLKKAVDDTAKAPASAPVRTVPVGGETEDAAPQETLVVREVTGPAKEVILSEVPLEAPKKPAKLAELRPNTKYPTQAIILPDDGSGAARPTEGPQVVIEPSKARPRVTETRITETRVNTETRAPSRGDWQRVSPTSTVVTAPEKPSADNLPPLRYEKRIVAAPRTTGSAPGRLGIPDGVSSIPRGQEPIMIPIESHQRVIAGPASGRPGSLSKPLVATPAAPAKSPVEPTLARRLAPSSVESDTRVRRADATSTSRGPTGQVQPAGLFTRANGATSANTNGVTAASGATPSASTAPKPIVGDVSKPAGNDDCPSCAQAKLTPKSVARLSAVPATPKSPTPAKKGMLAGIRARFGRSPVPAPMAPIAPVGVTAAPTAVAPVAPVDSAMPSTMQPLAGPGGLMGRLWSRKPSATSATPTSTSMPSASAVSQAPSTNPSADGMPAPFGPPAPTATVASAPIKPGVTNSTKPAAATGSSQKPTAIPVAASAVRPSAMPTANTPTAAPSTKPDPLVAKPVAASSVPAVATAATPSAAPKEPTRSGLQFVRDRVGAAGAISDATVETKKDVGAAPVVGGPAPPKPVESKLLTTTAKPTAVGAITKPVPLPPPPPAPRSQPVASAPMAPVRSPQPAAASMLPPIAPPTAGKAIITDGPISAPTPASATAGTLAPVTSSSPAAVATPPAPAAAGATTAASSVPVTTMKPAAVAAPAVTNAVAGKADPQPASPTAEKAPSRFKGLKKTRVTKSAPSPQKLPPAGEPMVLSAVPPQGHGPTSDPQPLAGTDPVTGQVLQHARAHSPTAPGPYDPRVAAHCVQILTYSSMDADRYRAVQMLAAMEDWQRAPGVALALRNVAMTDYNTYLRLTAVQMLGTIPADPQVVMDALRTSAQYDSDASIRATAGQLLGRMASRDAGAVRR